MEALILEAREGRAGAIARLIERYRNYLGLLARVSLGRRFQAKVGASDVVQEALLQAHQTFDRFQGGSEAELVLWLRKVLAWKVGDAVRRYAGKGRALARERPFDEEVERSSQALRGLLAADDTTPSAAAERRELGVILADALAELEPDHREVLVLRSLEEHDWGEIAARMGRSRDAVRMLWARALTRVRPLIEERR